MDETRSNWTGDPDSHDERSVAAVMDLIGDAFAVAWGQPGAHERAQAFLDGQLAFRIDSRGLAVVSTEGADPCAN